MRRQGRREPVHGRDDQVGLLHVGARLFERQEVQGLGQVSRAAERFRHNRGHVAAQEHPLASLILADRPVLAAVDDGEAPLLAHLVPEHGWPAHIVVATAFPGVPAAETVLAGRDDLAVLQAVLGVLVVHVVAGDNVAPIAGRSHLALAHSVTS